MALPAAAVADSSTDDLKQCAPKYKRKSALKKQGGKLHQQFLDLDRKSKLLDRKSELLDSATAQPACHRQRRRQRCSGRSRSARLDGDDIEFSAGKRASRTLRHRGGPIPGLSAISSCGHGRSARHRPRRAVKSAPIQGPSAAQQQAKQVIETAPSLSTAGGVLTPKGQFVIDPSVEFDYWSQNQLGVNGFQIIPGITFGNIFVTRFEQNILTAAATARYGVTDRLELNVKIPVVYNSGSTSSLIPVGAAAELLSVSANGAGIGDVQLGASYQLNSGENGWPIFVVNGLFKTATGTSPFEVPIITLNDPNGQFLSGTPKSLATGTGFYAVTPSVTVLLPTAPGVLFANLQDQHNFGATQPIQDRQGGPPTPVYLQPGESPAVTFGVGFALNDRAALTFSYQQTHVFSAFANHQEVAGSPYSFGTFNFGLGYQISQSTRLNLSVGIGAGPNTPAAKVLLEIPYKFSL